jgi:hypothetical protein
MSDVSSPVDGVSLLTARDPDGAYVCIGWPRCYSGSGLVSHTPECAATNGKPRVRYVEGESPVASIREPDPWPIIEWLAENMPRALELCPYKVNGIGVQPSHAASISFRPGDRVIRKYDGERGVVHAIYPQDMEDDCEVLLDSGIYTCVHHSNFEADRA